MKAIILPAVVFAMCFLIWLWLREDEKDGRGGTLERHESDPNHYAWRGVVPWVFLIGLGLLLWKIIS